MDHMTSNMGSAANVKTQRARFRPTIIIHGGAGVIQRDKLPPALYQRYIQSLARYANTCRALLDYGATALDMACHAVSLLEDDPLFNCGRGSVFTVDGHIEMEASVMVTSVSPDEPSEGSIKRTGAVSGVRNTRHPIQLAKAVLLSADADQGKGPVRDMHCHLSGRAVEQWGWKHGLKREEDDFFWTKRRWDEHRRGLKRRDHDDNNDDEGELPLPTQGTVGCVCFDQYGNMATATSTGGLTNKAPGRVGDTPMAGAGFWAESWDAARRPLGLEEEEGMAYQPPPPDYAPSSHPSSFWKSPEILQGAMHSLSACLPSLFQPTSPTPSSPPYTPLPSSPPIPHDHTTEKSSPPLSLHSNGSATIPQSLLRAIALSGTGNGDSFIRVAAARTVGAHCRFGSNISLTRAVRAMAGPGGELQRSARDRWQDGTGEGMGGIIGIEFVGDAATGQGEARSTADFNCEGMWRAYFQRLKSGREVLMVRVWRDEEYDDEDEYEAEYEELDREGKMEEEDLLG